MTTRAGLVGVISGIIISIFVHVLISTWPGAVLQNDMLIEPNAFIQRAMALMFLVTGFLAARWNHTVERWRCIALGGFSGIVAACFLYSLWGAAFAVFQVGNMQNVRIAEILQLGVAVFLGLLLIGGLFGAVGGYFYHPRKTIEKDIFNKDEPQMAMNASITAVSASIVAVAIAASTFPALSANINNGMVIMGPFLFPLYGALVILVLSQFALSLVVPHEAEQAEHVSGMDEVKMAAFVGIGTAPAIIVLLLVINGQLIRDLFIIVLLVCSVLMSMYSIRSLVKIVLPKRNSYPKHPTKAQKTQAIANSKAWRLVTLCIGCGMAMVFPIYISVLAPLININAISNNAGPIGLHTEQAEQLIWAHIKTGMGLNIIVILALSAMYIFYLNLGKWFQKRKISSKSE
jgi:hypothetical protein